ncbi:Mitochondrial chaperone Frataxin [Quaeritorhiza haematococci]|nr:Mitochondrial chaperone Frataxin [Quaeritorhiza haematococci]
MLSGLSVRFASNGVPPQSVSDLDINVYHKLADETIETMLEYFEALGDEIEIDGFDVTYSSGVLTLKLGEPGTYVINKQPPNKQIWLSSPISGPKRYDWAEDKHDWIYLREGTSLGDLLSEELSEILKRSMKVPT